MTCEVTIDSETFHTNDGVQRVHHARAKCSCGWAAMSESVNARTAMNAAQAATAAHLGISPSVFAQIDYAPPEAAYRTSLSYGTTAGEVTP